MKNLSNITLNNKYQFQNRVGSGSYGVVYSARHLYTGKTYAIKIILKNQTGHGNKQALAEMEADLLDTALLNHNNLVAHLLNLDLIERNGASSKILKEISLQLKVHKHPNILSLYKVYDLKSAIMVVMDYYPDGDLFNTIVEQQRYKNDPFLIKKVFLQLIDAITYCHSKNVYHCDIKPENILVTENGTKMILADFGLALQDQQMESNICCGSSYYMSPERIQNFCQGFNQTESHCMHLERILKPDDGQVHQNVKLPTSAGDVWSLAIILINLISIRNPWLKASLQDPTFKAFIKDPAVLLRILPISHEVYHILCKYLTVNPWERGNLFDLRQEVLDCRKLAEHGPLSVDSRISPADYHLYACQVPVDHVHLDKVRSREHSGMENLEPQREYILEASFPGPHEHERSSKLGMLDRLLHKNNELQLDTALIGNKGQPGEEEIRIMIHEMGSNFSVRTEASVSGMMASSECSLMSYDY
ncbi:hypothetical protein OGAPHI_003209 [Ogataea philodendri]|uniref:non-specific serine/threonine protein kinase n=1 Tax=Ogataea philodendri TaxID=1378263 RepID=A0A9P8P844_9ASCO|nr:uncharacterized protein OGAPHI_003209 [Ogataea philodendri]KAH3666760.1 hypothetical protein OGAPHI_003209 [Ogataea philodendri]